jgi:hypothetical protein
MKKHTIIILSFITLSLNAIQAQEFEHALGDAINRFKTDSTLPQIAVTANQFEMIAIRWNDRWLSHYYAVYAYTIYSYMETDEDKRDGLLDLADTHMQKAVELYGKESDELYALSAMIANARLAVKPGNRWKEYGVIFDENIAKAKELNPDNPRIYYLQGNSIYYTPKMFGGGAKNALPYYEKADSLFRILPLPDSLSMEPAWGNYQNADMLENARNEVTKKKSKKK